MAGPPQSRSEDAGDRQVSAKRGRAAFNRLLALLGIDFHILQVLLLRGWSIAAGAVMVLFVPFWLDATEQGYYFTFISLIAVQLLFELGFNQIIVQFVSHEAARLQRRGDGSLAGDRASVTRLASLVRLTLRWYRMAAALFFIVAGGAGILFFELQDEPSRPVVEAAWLALVFFSALNLALSPSPAILEGFGRIGDVARMRLTQSVIGYSATWIMLSLGAGLLATPVLAGVGSIYLIYWLRRHDRSIPWLKNLAIASGEPTLRWRRDILPLQWRIALSWVSGYVVLQLLVPVSFSRLGPVEAGRLGLTLTILTSLLTVGLSWVNARLPTMASHIARGERPAAAGVFRAVTLRSTSVVALGSIAVLLTVPNLPDAWRMRFVEPATIAFLSAATVANCVIYSMATFVRAHKEEPLLAQSIVTAIIMLPAILFGVRAGVMGIAAAFAAVICLLSLPWVTLIFRRFYRHPD